MRKYIVEIQGAEIEVMASSKASAIGKVLRGYKIADSLNSCLKVEVERVE